MVRARMLTLALLVMAVACSAETPEAEPVSPDDDVEVSPDTDGEPAEDDAGEDVEEPSADTDEDAEEPSADAGEDVDASTEPGSTLGFNPRMVLYDGDGEPVEAVISNFSSRFLQNPQAGDFWDPDSSEASCVTVYVESPGGIPTILSLRMEDGVVGGCSLYNEASFFYVSEDCSGPPHLFANDYQHVMVDGVPMRSFGQIVSPENASRWVDGVCVNSTNSFLLIPLVPMPSWMVNAFPNPPYEVRLEF